MAIIFCGAPQFLHLMDISQNYTARKEFGILLEKPTSTFTWPRLSHKEWTWHTCLWKRIIFYLQCFSSELQYKAFVGSDSTDRRTHSELEEAGCKSVCVCQCVYVCESVYGSFDRLKVFGWTFSCSYSSSSSSSSSTCCSVTFSFLSTDLQGKNNNQNESFPCPTHRHLFLCLVSITHRHNTFTCPLPKTLV